MPSPPSQCFSPSYLLQTISDSWYDFTGTSRYFDINVEQNQNRNKKHEKPIFALIFALRIIVNSQKRFTRFLHSMLCNTHCLAGSFLDHFSKLSGSCSRRIENVVLAKPVCQMSKYWLHNNDGRSGDNFIDHARGLKATRFESN